MSTKDSLWAINNSKNTLFAILFTIFACGLFLTGLIEAFINKNEINIEFVIVFFVIHPLIGMIGLRQFLWLVNGKQELIIKNASLILRKKGTFFTSDKVYDLNLVKNIREATDGDKLSLFEKTQRNISLNRKVLFGHVTGQILFDYKYDTIKIFNDMDSDEKKELINEMIKKKDELTKSV